MATNSSNSLELMEDEDIALGEQDRRKFKPLRKIKRIFKNKKKSKDISQSLGSILHETSEQSPTSQPNLVRSISHESVFANEVVSTLPDAGKMRNVMSVGDVTDVPMDQMKVSEKRTEKQSKSHKINADPNVRPAKTSLQVAKEDINMNDLTVDAPRLNNKLAYDKISVRPKRRPAKNARGAQQKHIVRVIEATPTSANGFTDAELTDEDSHERASKDGLNLFTKSPLPGVLISPTRESTDKQDEVSTESRPKPALRKSPIGAVQTGFVPSLQDVQAFRNRAKRTEEPVTAKENVSSPKVTVTKSEGKHKKSPKVAKKALKKSEGVDGDHKTKPDEKTKKSPKIGKKSPKKTEEGESSSIFSWKGKSKSPLISRKTKASEGAKEGERPKSIFFGLKGKKNKDKDAKTAPASASSSIATTDKTDELKTKTAEIVTTSKVDRKKAVMHDATSPKDKEWVEQTQNVAGGDVKSSKESLKVIVNKKDPSKSEDVPTSPVPKKNQASVSPTSPFKTGEVSLVEQMNLEMTKRMMKIHSKTVETKDAVSPQEDKAESVSKKNSVEREAEKDVTSQSPHFPVKENVAIGAEVAASKSGSNLPSKKGNLNRSSSDNPVPQSSTAKITTETTKIDSVSTDSSVKPDSVPSLNQNSSTKPESQSKNEVEMIPHKFPVKNVNHKVDDQPHAPGALSKDNGGVKEHHLSGTDTIKSNGDVSLQNKTLTKSLSDGVEKKSPSIKSSKKAAEKSISLEPVSPETSFNLISPINSPRAKGPSSPSSKVHVMPDQEKSVNETSPVKTDKVIPFLDDASTNSERSIHVPAKSRMKVSAIGNISEDDAIAPGANPQMGDSSKKLEDAKTATKRTMEDKVPLKTKGRSSTTKASPQKVSEESNTDKVSKNPGKPSESFSDKTAEENSKDKVHEVSERDLKNKPHDERIDVQTTPDTRGSRKEKPVSKMDEDTSTIDSPSSAPAKSPVKSQLAKALSHERLQTNTKDTSKASPIKADQVSDVEVQVKGKSKFSDASSPDEAHSKLPEAKEDRKDEKTKRSAASSSESTLTKTPREADKRVLHSVSKSEVELKPTRNLSADKNRESASPSSGEKCNNSKTNVAKDSPLKTSKEASKNVLTASADIESSKIDRTAGMLRSGKERTKLAIQQPAVRDVADTRSKAKSPPASKEKMRSKSESNDTKSSDKFVSDQGALAAESTPSSVQGKQSSKNDTKEEQSNELYSKTKLKPISRTLQNRKSNSMRISPGEHQTPVSETSRPRSWNAKFTGELEASHDQPTRDHVPGPSPCSQSSPTKEKPKIARRPKSPVKSPMISPVHVVENTDNKPEEVKEKPSAADNPKPAPRRSTAKQKEETGGAEPEWFRIARRHSRHWEDGAVKPRSTSKSSPTEPEKERPPALSVAPKKRATSTSKLDVLSRKSSPVTPTWSAQSNRTSSVSAISSSPTSKASQSVKESPVPVGGKPAWLAIAMQKQKNWGAKEEMV